MFDKNLTEFEDIFKITNETFVLRQSWRNPYTKRTSINFFCYKKLSKSMKNAFIFVQTNCNDFFWSRLISKKHFGGTKVKMTNQTKLEVTDVFDYRAVFSKRG